MIVGQCWHGLEVLSSEGVRYNFGNPGTTELPLMDALIQRGSFSSSGVVPIIVEAYRRSEVDPVRSRVLRCSN
jgi:hypothetical protein